MPATPPDAHETTAATHRRARDFSATHRAKPRSWSDLAATNDQPGPWRHRPGSASRTRVLLKPAWDALLLYVRAAGRHHRFMAAFNPLKIHPETITRFILASIVLCTICLSACDVERRKSDAELGLNPQQAAGRKVYDYYCDRCH